MRSKGLGTWIGAVVTATVVVAAGIGIGSAVGALAARPDPLTRSVSFDDYGERLLRAAEQNRLDGWNDYAERVFNSAQDGQSVESFGDYADRHFGAAPGVESRAKSIDGWEDYAERILRRAQENK